MSKLESHDMAIQKSGGSGHQTRDAEGLQRSVEEKKSLLEAFKNIVETFFFWMRRLTVVNISTFFQLILHNQ